MAKNKNISNFEFYESESHYASPAEVTSDATERIRRYRERSTKFGKLALQKYNQK